MEASDLPLRERKQAQIKLDILYALLEKLKEKTIDEVSVEELCERALISKVTFYNYFSNKQDILFFFLRLQDLEIAWHVKENVGENAGKEALLALFSVAESVFQKNPQVLASLRLIFHRSKKKPGYGDLSCAEKLLAFPGLSGIESVEAKPLPELVLGYLSNAKKLGELPEKTDDDVAFSCIVSVIGCMHRSLLKRHGMKHAPALKQFEVVWSGLQETYGKEKK